MILGPTATGKSRCGIRLAQELDGEIISGDSMLVYRQMNIGTAKPSASELALVPHHLVDILPPDALFSVVDFKERAAAAIKVVNARGRLPILVGGDRLVFAGFAGKDYQFSSVPGKSGFAAGVGTVCQRQRRRGAACPFAGFWTRPRHSVCTPMMCGGWCGRWKRPWPVKRSPGKKKRNWPMTRRYSGCRWNGLFYMNGSTGGSIRWYSRDWSRKCAVFWRAGCRPMPCPMKSLGYRQMAEYLAGDYDLSAAIDHIKKGTRHFAKRQITWYKQMPYVHWFLLDRSLNYEKIVRRHGFPPCGKQQKVVELLYTIYCVLCCIVMRIRVSSS